MRQLEYTCMFERSDDGGMLRAYDQAEMQMLDESSLDESSTLWSDLCK